MRVALVDFSNFLYKYKNTIRAERKINSILTNTSPLIGVERTLKYMLDFDEIVFAIDGFPKLFYDILPSYKGSRDRVSTLENSVKTTYTLAHAVAVAEDYDINFKLAAALNEEADQVISSIIYLNKTPISPLFHKSTSGTLKDDRYLKRYSEHFALKDPLPIYPPNTEFVIGTTDADMYQLAQFEGVAIANDVICKTLRTDTPKAVQSLPPYTIPSYKALFGDTSDNIPTSFDRKIISTAKVIQLLQDDIATPQDLQLFTRSLKLQSSDILPPNLKVLYRAVIKQSHNFFRNLELTSMRYYSTPRQLTLTDEALPALVYDRYLKRKQSLRIK